MTFEALEVTVAGGVQVIVLNQPKRKNAFNATQYNEVIAALEQAKNDPAVRCVVITGRGDYYSSGNDLSVFTAIDLSNKEKLEQELADAKAMLTRFVNSFIFFPKILIAALNGPAIGVAATTAQHCDFVYGSESCTINTPFVPLAQVPEACSSFTFPRIMGPLKANEMLLLGKKFDARQALAANLLNDVFPDKEFMSRVMAIAHQIGTFPRLMDLIRF
eukprot:TRINITY_DN6160_c0_g1_i1.p1 TRINITY_DN6160_c0_g1~~TRINITY_DN6160_c0_g1_i1.p1  ORF type:complete len:218 (-),score=16.55 TRINITY_DN6160_c0_g1_i1:279-932(-)